MDKRVGVKNISVISRRASFARAARRRSGVAIKLCRARACDIVEPDLFAVK